MAIEINCHSQRCQQLSFFFTKQKPFTRQDGTILFAGRENGLPGQDAKSFEMKPKQQGTGSSTSRCKSSEQVYSSFSEIAHEVSETARQTRVLNNHMIER